MRPQIFSPGHATDGDPYGIPTGENHIPIPMGMGIHMEIPIGIPTEILWEWDGNGNGNPFPRQSYNPWFKVAVWPYITKVTAEHNSFCITQAYETCKATVNNKLVSATQLTY